MLLMLIHVYKNYTDTINWLFIRTMLASTSTHEENIFFSIKIPLVNMVHTPCDVQLLNGFDV